MSLNMTLYPHSDRHTPTDGYTDRNMDGQTDRRVIPVYPQKHLYCGGLMKSFKNIEGKGENAGNQHIPLPTIQYFLFIS